MTPKKKLLALGAVVLLLAAAYWYGGGAPGLQGWQAAPSVPASSAQGSGAMSSSAQGSGSSSSQQPPQDQASDPSGSQGDGSASRPEETPPAGGQAGDSTASSAPAQSSPPSEEETTAVSPPPAEGPAPEQSQEEALVCTVSIRCDAVLEHMDWLDPAIAALIPADGVILTETQASFEEGETAFDLLQRLTRQEGIHLEASFTPGYGSSYVEGIANLYEFDCGQQSGWLYLVNGVSPGYGGSQYVLSPGDVVEWIYTCDMGQSQGATE